jgi:hypothetical protein
MMTVTGLRPCASSNRCVRAKSLGSSCWAPSSGGFGWCRAALCLGVMLIMQPCSAGGRACCCVRPCPFWVPSRGGADMLLESGQGVDHQSLHVAHMSKLYPGSRGVCQADVLRTMICCENRIMLLASRTATCIICFREACHFGRMHPPETRAFALDHEPHSHLSALLSAELGITPYGRHEYQIVWPTTMHRAISRGSRRRYCVQAPSAAALCIDFVATGHGLRQLKLCSYHPGQHSPCLHGRRKGLVTTLTT